VGTATGTSLAGLPHCGATRPHPPPYAGLVGSDPRPGTSAEKYVLTLPSRHNAGVNPVIHYAAFGAGLLVMTALTVGLGRWAGVGLGWFPLWAILRAVVQLSVVALLLRGILAVPWTVAAFVVLMLSTASWTAADRLGGLWHGRRTAVTGVLTGAVITVGLIFSLRLVDIQVRYVVAIAGIIVGNSMTAATLAGRNFLRAARARRDEIEAWLSLGATPGFAHQEVGREAVRESLLPTLDQTKSTGLVTLPGAFVGALFGGASPATAAQFQLVVLVGIAMTMTITGIVVSRLAGRSPYLTVNAEH
jgi:putative ABC transport system permease protein